MKNVRKILMNTLLLTGVSFMMQTVNVSFNVWLTNRIGAAGTGLFQLITTVYGLSITLGCGGVRLASTRLAAEAEAEGEKPGRIIKSCVRYGLSTGCFIALTVLFGAQLISTLWLEDARCVVPLRILALSVPFVAMSSALGGYFTAMRKIARFSSIRILEQTVKIVSVVLLLGWLLPLGTAYSCIAIVMGITISEAFSFICLYILYITDNGSYKIKKPKKGDYKKITHIAVPDVSGAGARSVLLTIEHILIPSGFRKSGSSAEQSLAVYGTIHGMVFPLLLYPSAILTSLSGLLVPEIAECRSKGFENQINYVIKRVMKITLIFSIAVSGIMYAFAGGLSQLVYNNSDSMFFIKLLAPLIPVMYCDMTVDGILKGLDQQYYTMKYNIIDSALCVVLVYFLLPRYSVRGYVFVLFASEIINFFLSVRRLTIVSTVTVNPVYDILIPIACIFCSVSGVSVLAEITGISAAFSVFSLTLCIIASLAAYFALMYMFSCIKDEDISWFLSVLGINGRTKKLRTGTAF